jgi:V/A-type H+-transporting ATPase subunit K
MNKRIVTGALFLLVLSFALSAQDATAAAASTASWKYMAAAIAVGLACIGGGMAVGRLGAAAMGAIAEDASLSGKALPYLGLAEGICLWGFLVALLILLI